VCVCVSTNTVIINHDKKQGLSLCHIWNRHDNTSVMRKEDPYTGTVQVSLN